MSYRKLFSLSFIRPTSLRRTLRPSEWPLLRYSYSVLEGPAESTLMARATTLGESSTSSTSSSEAAKAPTKDIAVERKVLAYPPKHYFDTYKVITELQNAGYSDSQAEAIVSLLTKSLQKSLEPLWASIITHKQMELVEQKISAELKSVRASLVLVERSAIDSLRSENEVLKKQVQNLTNVFKEEVTKVQAGLRLDLNLEKSRIKEESSGLEQRVKDTNNRIDFEVAQLKTQIESQKVESIKYLAGGIFSIVTIILSVVLGLWRLMK